MIIEWTNYSPVKNIFAYKAITVSSYMRKTGVDKKGSHDVELMVGTLSTQETYDIIGIRINFKIKF